MTTVNRSRIRRRVCAELRRVRTYRQALRTPERVRADERDRMRTWVRIADETLAAIRSEPEGERRASFFNDVYGLTHRCPGNGKYVFSRGMNVYHMSLSGLERWRENGIFIASLLAIQYGMIDLSSET